MAQRAKAAVMAVASADHTEKPEKPPTIFERLFGKLQSSGSSTASALAFASADVGSTSSLGPASQNIASVGTGALYDRQTAVYDISAHMVYLPDGTKLEAHSGLGSSLDDPRSASIRMRGVTPTIFKCEERGSSSREPRPEWASRMVPSGRYTVLAEIS